MAGSGSMVEEGQQTASSSPVAAYPVVELDPEHIFDDLVTTEATLVGSPATVPAPVPASTSTSMPTPALAATVVVPTRRQRRAARRLQARKVGRLVRRVDPWSVLKLALLVHLCAFLVTLLAGTLLWTVAVNAGVVGDLEGFIREAFALESFRFEGGQIFQAAVFGGLVLVLAATAATVLIAGLFNLISDLTGGVRLVVVEEETARPAPPRRLSDG